MIQKIKKSEILCLAPIFFPVRIHEVILSILILNLIEFYGKGLFQRQILYFNVLVSSGIFSSYARISTDAGGHPSTNAWLYTRFRVVFRTCTLHINTVNKFIINLTSTYGTVPSFVRVDISG